MRVCVSFPLSIFLLYFELQWGRVLLLDMTRYPKHKMLMEPQVIFRGKGSFTRHRPTQGIFMTVFFRLRSVSGELASSRKFILQVPTVCLQPPGLPAVGQVGTVQLHLFSRDCQDPGVTIFPLLCVLPVPHALHYLLTSAPWLVPLAEPPYTLTSCPSCQTIVNYPTICLLCPHLHAPERNWRNSDSWSLSFTGSLGPSLNYFIWFNAVSVSLNNLVPDPAFPPPFFLSWQLRPISALASSISSRRPLGGPRGPWPQAEAKEPGCLERDPRFLIQENCHNREPLRSTASSSPHCLSLLKLSQLVPALTALLNGVSHDHDKCLSLSPGLCLNCPEVLGLSVTPDNVSLLPSTLDHLA